MANNKQPLPLVCPVCQGEMEIRELECKSCDLQVRGHFGRGSRFDQLSPEQSAFLEVFLRSRGILRDVESALGISYPTVRARLDNLLAALGFTEDGGARGPAKTPASGAADGAANRSARRREILAALEAGSIDAQAAMEALQELK
jgi:hypothetical protein